MGCTSSTPNTAAAATTYQKDVNRNVAASVESSTNAKKDTPPSVASEAEPNRAASSVQNVPSAASSTASTSVNMQNVVSSSPSQQVLAAAAAQAQPPVALPPPAVAAAASGTPANKNKAVGFEPSSSFKEQRGQPAMTEQQQPPTKRGANTEAGKQQNRSSFAEDEIDPVKPRRLDDFYEVDRTKRIGKGHYASVFIGKNRQTGQRVAVKMIEKRLSKTERLALEVNVMRKAGEHPNIVQLIDVFETENQLQLVLELVEGGELFEHLVEHGPYSEATAAMHIRDVTRAIGFLHSQNIIHRDLKPENLLLTSKDDSARVKVADFGLAKLMFADVTRTVCGTWAYCAYEVKKPGGAYDNKCDLWSIGVIAYILLSAYHPFDPQGDSTDDEIWEKISRADYNFNDPAWNNVSETAKDFVSKLLVLDPKKRLSAEEALQHPWLKEVAEIATHEDKEHPQPALSPAINDKLASFQRKAAMNPLQKAAAAMKNRVGSWKSSSVGSSSSLTGNNNNNNGGGGSGGSNSGSPSWARRSMVIAAAAAAAAARTSRRSGGPATPTNDGDKARSWSTGSGGKASPSSQTSPLAAAAASLTPTSSAAGFFEEKAEEPYSPVNNKSSAPFTSSPLKTAVLAAVPSADTLVTPVTPGALPVEADEGTNEVADQHHSEAESPEPAQSSPVATIQTTQTSEAVAGVIAVVESPVVASSDGNTSGAAHDDDEATMPSEEEEDEEIEGEPGEGPNETFVSARSDKESDLEASFVSAKSNATDAPANTSSVSKSSKQ